MPLTGIIAEFNPFHLGHTLPIQAARAVMEGEGAVVCVMSGNAVQRGDLAIFNKHARAEAAIRCGADLVIELPLPYILGSAERFAQGGVALLNALGIPDTYLAFGSEIPDGNALSAIAKALDAPETQATIAANMRAGLSYGSACQKALAATDVDAALLQTPNNLLAIEYLRAITRQGAAIQALPIKREGAPHDGHVPADGYASATYLRTLLHPVGGDAPGAPSWEPYMPPVAADICRRELIAGRGPIQITALEPAILSLLRLGEPPPAGYLDDSEGLAARLTRLAREVESLAELLERAKTKRYHLSRLRRLILTVCLGLIPADRPEIPPYIRPLAMNQSGQALLRRMTKTAHLPILSRPAEAKKLGPQALRLMEKEAALSDLLALCYTAPASRRPGGEWRVIPHLVELVPVH